jgi:hypothetical protein
MRGVTFERAIGALLAVGALVAVMIAALMQGNEQAMGALVAVLAAAVGYFLRGRVQGSGG